MDIKIGQIAPPFSLYDSEKNKVSLEEQKGKNVVLLFFPQAFTGVCTTELCSVRDSISQYNDTNAQVFGISVDSIFTLAKFKEAQQLNFPLLSDFNKEVSAKYDSLIEDFVFDMKGVSKRAAFVIDREGIIRYAEILDKVTELPNFEAIRETLEKIK